MGAINDMIKNELKHTDLTLKDFYYDLPESFIAQTPAEPRDSSRLMVIDRATGKITHRHFRDIVDLHVVCVQHGLSV